MKKTILTQGFWLLLLLLPALPTTVTAQAQVPEVVVNTCGFTHGCARPTANHTLDAEVSEGSGLTVWNGLIWTHNDSGHARIYALDSANGKIIKTVDLPGVANDDWEEISQDRQFLYVGNFGNNAGNKERLQIYRLSKAALLRDKAEIDSITFQWPDLGIPDEPKINFDCEAMVLLHDSIFLFTKEYKKHRRSRIFKIPATPGNHTAEYVATLKTRLLVTGADYAPEKNRLVLCGYSLTLKPRLLVLSLPESGNLKKITKGKKIRIRKKLQQVEGLCSFDKESYYLIVEAMNFWLWKNKPKLYRITIK